jgi:hypothetical protein
MKIAKNDVKAFEEYLKPLRSLEGAFKKAGLRISFHVFDYPVHGKAILINSQKTCIAKISIEGDSPAQAVKDVAAAVKL